MSSRPVELFGLAAPEMLGQQREPLHQPRDIDDALLEHRAVAGERHALGVEAFELLASRARPRPGRKLARTR